MSRLEIFRKQAKQLVRWHRAGNHSVVSRDAACLHLKFVHQPALDAIKNDNGFITAFVDVGNVKALYAEYAAAGVAFAQALRTEAWGGRDFIVRAPDGHAIAFVEMPR